MDQGLIRISSSGNRQVIRKGGAITSWPGFAVRINRRRASRPRAGEEAKYGFHLTDRERKGHDPLPEPLEPMTFDEAAIAARDPALNDAVWDKNHPDHELAVDLVSELYQRAEVGEKIIEGGGEIEE